MKPFLTTEWHHPVMLNYEVDPKILLPFVPRGTELDDYNGKHFVSMVGFLYRDTRVRGLAIPWHRNFPEVNLRYYIRHRAADGWRRGVAFIKEIVPRRAIALVARKLYDENFVAHPMRSTIELDESASLPKRVEYAWKDARGWHRLEVSNLSPPTIPALGSLEEFITEHYWGYTARRDGRTSEYRVDHPPWKVSLAGNSELSCDVTSVYGPMFAGYLAARPSSAFLAEGSAVAVYPGSTIAHS